jgi:two-component system, NtrC family, nitrogen regulation response regulator GlnG
MRNDAHASTERPPNTGPVYRMPGRHSVPALTVIWHPDLDRVGEICLLEELAGGAPQSVSRLAPKFQRPGSDKRRAIEDTFVSRSASLTMVQNDCGDLELRPEGNEAPVEVRGVRLDRALRVSKSEIEGGIIILLARRIVLCLHRLQVPVVRGADMEMMGVGDGIERVRKLVRRVAGTEVPVLIRGETGTGKELVARALVGASKRANRPFVAVNMAAISPTTAVAEMFGHERGAFTGAAAARGGYFGEAAGGTLLLDEFGLTPPELQRTLLRVLEPGEFVPVPFLNPSITEWPVFRFPYRPCAGGARTPVFFWCIS